MTTTSEWRKWSCDNCGTWAGSFGCHTSEKAHIRNDPFECDNDFFKCVFFSPSPMTLPKNYVTYHIIYASEKAHIRNDPFESDNDFFKCVFFHLPPWRYQKIMWLTTFVWYVCNIKCIQIHIIILLSTFYPMLHHINIRPFSLFLGTPPLDHLARRDHTHRHNHCTTWPTITTLPSQHLDETSQTTTTSP